MLCKKCDEKVEPQYENGGLCENCSADGWAHLSNDYENGLKPENMEKEEILELPISCLRLSTRTSNRLSVLGITCINNLAKYSEEKLLKAGDIGNAALKEINISLQALGLALACSSDPNSAPIP